MKKCFTQKCWCTTLAAGVAMLLAAAPAMATGDPDCDCDGVSDAKEIASCVAACVAGGGNDAGCADACTTSGGLPKDCSGAATACDDDNSCTDDSCDGSNGKCTNQVPSARCDDGLACTIDVCKPVPAGRVCNGTTDACDTADDCSTSACSITGADCATDDDCNPTINETCVKTENTCDDTTPYSCVNKPVDAACDDSDACTFDACLPAFTGDLTKASEAICGGAISDTLDPTTCEGDGVDDGGIISDLDVRVKITHTWIGDVTLVLEHKDTGTSAIIVASGFLPSSDGMDILWDDEDDCSTTVCTAAICAGACTPLFFSADGLSVFDGESKAGTWTLTATDGFGGDDGTLDSFELIFNNFPGGCKFTINPAIDDGFDCTIDSCDVVTGSITHAADDTLCDDSINCTKDDVCDPADANADSEGCVFTPENILCDDNDDCTDDVCNPDPGEVCVGGGADGDGCDSANGDDDCFTGTTCDVGPNAGDACTSDGDCLNGTCLDDGSTCQDAAECENTAVSTDKDDDGCCDAADPCDNDPKLGCSFDNTVAGSWVADSGACTEVIYKAIIRSEKSGLNTVPDGGFLPDEDTVHLQNGCFVIEVWVQERTDAKSGIACAFADFDWGTELACQPKWTLTNWNDTFDQFRAGTIDNNDGSGANLGACTLLQGVGIFPRWHRLATLHYDANHPKCKNVFTMTKAEKGASLMNVGEAKEFDFRNSLLDVECLGFIYDLVDSNRDVGPQGEVQPADFALFAPCWMAGGDGDLGDCANVDWDCDGVVGPGDLNFFATAWQKEVCEPGIVVPACQLHCNTDATGNGEGTLTSRGDYLPWASREMIAEFGLPVPPRGWAGWALDPSNNDDSRIKTRRGNTSRSTRR